jgi:hypothetical protein
MPPDVRRGYAAGCEARLCRAVRGPHKAWASPLVRPPAYAGQARTGGTAPLFQFTPAGQSPAAHPAA